MKRKMSVSFFEFQLDSPPHFSPCAPQPSPVCPVVAGGPRSDERPPTAGRGPRTMSTHILFQDQARPRPRRERASGAHTRQPTPSLEAGYRHTHRRLPRSLRSRIRARSSTKVHGPRARGLRTRATSDLVRLTTCSPPHSYTLAMPPDRGRLRHAPRPRREHGLVAA